MAFELPVAVLFLPVVLGVVPRIGEGQHAPASQKLAEPLRVEVLAAVVRLVGEGRAVLDESLFRMALDGLRTRLRQEQNPGPVPTAFVERWEEIHR